MCGQEVFAPNAKSHASILPLAVSWIYTNALSKKKKTSVEVNFLSLLVRPTPSSLHLMPWTTSQLLRSTTKLFGQFTCWIICDMLYLAFVQSFLFQWNRYKWQVLAHFRGGTRSRTRYPRSFEMFYELILEIDDFYIWNWTSTPIASFESHWSTIPLGKQIQTFSN